MQPLEGKEFFDNIRRSIKFSHFVSSIIPLSLLVYFSIKYVYPYVTAGDVSKIPLDIAILLLLVVVVSVLGLILSTKTINSSIISVQDLNLKLNSLFDITRQFRETIYLDILLEKIVKSAMDLISAETGSLLLHDEHGDLRFKVTIGKDSQKMNNRVLKPDEGIAGWVVKTGTAALIKDASTDQRYNPAFDNEAGLKTRSVMCVPLIFSNETIGVIELRNKNQGAFTKRDEALLLSLADQASISIVQSRSKERQHSDLIHIIEILVGVQDYLQNRRGHARRVANNANILGKYLGLPENELKNLYYASLLHDIGMLKIDKNDHWKKEIIMQHSKLGYDLIKSVSFWSDSADIILHHHERYDGTGYPLSKKKEEIPLGARILFVADTFDVLISGYSYKQFDHDAALREIEKNSGTQFDPLVVEALKSSIISIGH